jgi:hypothetical protein
MASKSKTVPKESVVARSWATLTLEWEVLKRLLEDEDSFLGARSPDHR